MKQLRSKERRSQEAAKVQRKEVPGTTQLRSHERRCVGQKAVTQWSMGGRSHRLHSKVAQGRRAAPGQVARGEGHGQHRQARRECREGRPAGKGDSHHPALQEQRGKAGRSTSRSGRAWGGGGVQLAVRGGAADRSNRKNNGNSKIRDNRQVENSESSKNRSKNK